MEISQLDAYLQQLQVPSTTEKKIRATLAFIQENKLLAPESMFVNQTKDEDANIRTTRLWLFELGFCSEADISNGKISCDVAALRSKIRRCEITASDSEFDDPDFSKYLNIEASMHGGLICRLGAFGANRRQLWNVFIKYIRPNVAP
jgi:hypothetical protein